jgi:hypothetical protein
MFFIHIAKQKNCRAYAASGLSKKIQPMAFEKGCSQVKASHILQQCWPALVIFK